jgi:hypothetical protein
MKGFGRIALLFGVLGGLMAYFIVPVQFSRKRALSPTEKAEYALTVNYYKRHCGPVTEEIEERANAYARESREDIWAGYDVMFQNRGLVIGSPTWCRFMGAVWLKPVSGHSDGSAAVATSLEDRRKPTVREQPPNGGVRLSRPRHFSEQRFDEQHKGRDEPMSRKYAGRPKESNCRPPNRHSTVRRSGQHLGS